jgi:hydroxymethylpyrimidine pyrophosphatase-like HAD family hydrolase
VTVDPFAAWSARDDVPLGAIRAVLVDVDGVVTPGEGRPADVAVIAKLREINAAAAIDPFTPALALCTGRQAPYVEAFAQLTGTFLPSIFEHGAGLFVPAPFGYVFSPALPRDIQPRIAAVRDALRRDLLEPGRAFVQPGKEATVTLYPLGTTTVDDVLAVARKALASFADFRVVHNASCVEVLPLGIDKASGLRWLAAELSLAPEAFAGVGDAETDLGFLQLAGWSAAPANAAAAVTRAVDYASGRPNGEGLVDILQRIVSANRLGGRTR